jgi:putative membrane protein
MILKTGIIILGVVLLIIGFYLIEEYSKFVTLAEAYAGDWAVLSPEYREYRSMVILGQILTAIGIILIIVGIIVKIKSRTKRTSNLDILKERYAKGEITKEEFDEMKEDLS